jgi:hypothetical protein
MACIVSSRPIRFTEGAVLRVGTVLMGLRAGVAILAAVELGLRLTGVGEGPPAYDPMAGFSGG